MSTEKTFIILEDSHGTRIENAVAIGFDTVVRAKRSPNGTYINVFGSVGGETIPAEILSAFANRLSGQDVTPEKVAEASEAVGLTRWLKEHGVEAAGFLTDFWDKF
ncbi:hypothetical protein [uncultured Enterovirga sp.]|uniref:hypothetical protein n=1 Tax=uncultured Enterovirga sp. TaxID=2026352 RepID=UPI0035CA0B17